MKIAVYAISKNEEQFVERFCTSAKDADYIIIGDTGSTDGTVSSALQAGAVVHQISIRPWRFDLARNAVLALIPAEVEVCISLDLDEVLMPGWRQEIERVWVEGKTTQLRYQFHWGEGIQYAYEKIHSRTGFFWHHPCHEYPLQDRRCAPVWAETDMLLVDHQPDSSKSRGQYLDLLKLSIEEDPHCPRNAFYYARELTFYACWPEAIEQLNRYLSLPGATWPNERAYAYRLLGQAYRIMGNMRDSERCLIWATIESPDTREPWVELAQHYYFTQHWPSSYAAAKRALAITDKAKVYTCDPKVWGWWPYDLLTIAAWNIGLFNESLESATKALELEPDNEHLQKNFVAVRESMVKMGLIKSELAKKKRKTKRDSLKKA